MKSDFETFMTCHMAISQLLSHKASGDHIDPHRSGLQLAPLHVKYVVVYQYSYLNSHMSGYYVAMALLVMPGTPAASM